MHVFVNITGVRQKYGAQAEQILTLTHALGTEHDTSGIPRREIHNAIGALPDGEAVLLVGGYDLVPTFVLANPTDHVETQGDDNVPSDAPYGGAPGNAAQQLVPPRPIARVPDGPDTAGADFIHVLRSVSAGAATPGGAFHMAAYEFAKPATDVAHAMGSAGPVLLSPPLTLDSSAVARSLVGSGRLHVLLHGADTPGDWAALYGHVSGASAWPVGLDATVLSRTDLGGAVATFSSCYAAMIDLDASGEPARHAGNQVALACLRAGAKAVFACTRSNWIEPGSGDELGPGLMLRVWRGLANHRTAGQALAEAKRDLATAASVRTAALSPKERKLEMAYVYKTLTQAQLYGNPEARL